MEILLFLIITLILVSITGYMLFPKLDLPAWKGAVPVLRWMEIAEKVGRSRFYGLWVLVPLVNLFIITGLSAALVRSFGKLGLKETVIAVLYAPISFFMLAKDEKAEFKEPIITKEREYLTSIREAKTSGNTKKMQRLIETNPYSKSIIREWFESIVFAVFAAAFIRMFFIEAYVIPTPSMEGTLLVGDFLFVSKMSYGIRTPQTVAMIPLLHNRIPGLNKESYLKSPSLPYYRLPPRSLPKRNEPFVFNWPVGDSVYITPTRSWTLGQIERSPEYVNYDKYLKEAVDNKDYVVRPLDKKDHYIKRCVGIAGDSLQIIDGQLYINGQMADNPEHLQFQYLVSGNLNSINPLKWEEWGVGQEDMWGNPQRGGFFLDQKQVEQIKAASPQVQIIREVNPPDPERLFPFDAINKPNWSVDNYGPIWIPKKGVTVTLTKENLPFFHRAISVYENTPLDYTNGKFIINGVETDQYTFKQNYYWAMGDNRHNSEDSRMWGYVPFDHVMGKPALVWFSTKNGSIRNGVRWDRIFKPAGNL